MSSVTSEQTKKTKVNSILPLDCIIEILEHLENDSITPQTLYSCLLANRQMAKLTIPLLWRCPFGYKINAHKASHIFQTLVKCLKDDEKQRWIDIGIKTQSNSSLPLFDYPSYIRSLNTHNMQSCVSEWLEIFQDVSEPYKTEKMGFTINLIVQLIFSRSKGLETLRWDHDFNYNCNETNDFRGIYPILRDIEHYDGIDRALSSIKIFETQCWDGLDEDSGKVLTNYIRTISRYARNVHHIEFDVYLRLVNYKPLCEALAHFVESQAALRSIELFEWLDHSHSSSVYDSLRTQAHSLTSLRTNNLRFFHRLLPVLSNCPNLRILGITNFYEIENISPLMDSIQSLPPIHVTHLTANFHTHYEANCWHFSLVVQLLIRLSSKRLEFIKLDCIDAKIIETISQFCPRIPFLSIHVTLKELPSLCTNLPLLNSLHHLILVIKSSTPESLTQLAQSFPVSLKHLGVKITKTPELLGSLLENVKVKMETLDCYNKVNNELIEIIVKFAKRNGKMKKLGVEDGKITFDDHGLTNEISEVVSRFFEFVGEPSNSEICYIREHGYDDANDDFEEFDLS